MRLLARWTVRLLVGFILFTIGGALVALSRREQSARPEDPEADEIDLAAVMAPLAYRSHARAFRGGRCLTWYGGGVIDLRGATLDPAGATVRVRCLFGGGQLVVPEGWDVRLRVLPIFGGCADSRPRVERGPDAPRLTIEGLTVFGGFAVMSRLDAGQEEWLRTNAPAEA